MAKKISKVSRMNMIFAASLASVGIIVVIYFIFSLSARLAMSTPIAPTAPTDSFADETCSPTKACSDPIKYSCYYPTASKTEGVCLPNVYRAPSVPPTGCTFDTDCINKEGKQNGQICQISGPSKIGKCVDNVTNRKIITPNKGPITTKPLQSTTKTTPTPTKKVAPKPTNKNLPI